MSVNVSLNNVTLSYNRHPAVHHISGRFSSGSLTAIAGPNGAGKSTLLKGIAGILTPDEGHIIVEDGAHIAYLPQVAGIERDFPMSVLHMVATGFWHQTGSMGEITLAMQKQCLQALADVGLPNFGKRDLASLSAGQFQRALFARLMVQDASLILLDEPFTAIDTETTARLLDIILRWHSEGRTVICVLHDFDQIRKYFPSCLLLARECVAWGDSGDVLGTEILKNAHMFRDSWQTNPEVCAL